MTDPPPGRKVVGVGGRAGIPTRRQAAEFLAARGVELDFADPGEGPEP